MIYFVEDDYEIGYVIEKTIEHIGYKSIKFSKGFDFKEAFQKQKPDMVLLDIMLPDMSGLDLLKWIRKDDQNIPIMMISALQSEMDKVIALDLGADDYMIKPFGVLELTSRIQSKMRRFQESNLIQFKNISMDIKKHTCLINNQPTYLTNKEYDILKLLLTQKNQVVHKETIFEVVWETDFIGETRALDMHIKSLRQKLKQEGSEAMIETVRGIGYQVI
jgi:two-component system, OmpR family, alkaline phosphatase synthesis response regulator PhoP